MLGALEEITPDQALFQFNTNFFGVLNVTNAFLPHFRSKRGGLIINISSDAATNATPGTGSESDLDSCSWYAV